MDFSVPKHKQFRCHSGQFSLHLSHYVNRESSLSMKSSRDRRSRWYHLSTYLVLHHTAWSAQKGMSTFRARNLVYACYNIKFSQYCYLPATSNYTALRFLLCSVTFRLSTQVKVNPYGSFFQIGPWRASKVQDPYVRVLYSPCEMNLN